MKKLIAGNWKMNGTASGAESLAEAILKGIEADAGLLDACDFVVCPPFVHLAGVRDMLEGTAVEPGAQDCALNPDGAYTGDVSAAMLKDIGCRWVILGHSERRQHHGERDAEIAAKARLAHGAGLKTIVCVGETEAEREQGREKDVVGRQLAEALPSCATPENTVIAYEPVWAIGTGKTATPQDVAAMHAFIRAVLKEKVANSAQMRILYGGSVKPDNAAALLSTPNVDGALIGGASLKADQYLAIAAAAGQDAREARRA